MDSGSFQTHFKALRTDMGDPPVCGIPPYGPGPLVIVAPQKNEYFMKLTICVRKDVLFQSDFTATSGYLYLPGFIPFGSKTNQI